MSTTLGISLPSVGYLRRERSHAIHTIDQILPIVRDELEALFPGHVPQGGREVLESLETLGPDLWPMEVGPVVRRLAETVVIDVWAASTRLIDDMRVPAQTGGILVNAPARRFEQAVQQRINDTPWHPGEDSRGLLRTLRLGGTSITDIDAIAERNGTLLLISCKNIPFTPKYDAGDFRTVRNAASTVDNAVAFWQQVVAKLQSSPIGDNYDVSHYAEIKGVVVTPQVLYSNNAVTLAGIDVGDVHLRGAVSLGELARALS